MRQAGRFLPEYRELREDHGILEICRTPELATEVTLMPIRRFPVDAAIVFSDIMIPVAAAGVDLRIDPGAGPVIETPIRSAADVERLRDVEPDEDLGFLRKTIEMLVGELDVPLIGFAGGPFTLASYLIEGGASRTFARTKAMMLGDEAAWAELMDRLVRTAITSLRLQVEAGATAVQVFDSWVGALSPRDYRTHVLPYAQEIFSALDDLDVPRIHFGVGTGELLPSLRDAGADVVGVDWRVPLDEAWGRIGHETAVQGNLDPAVLFAPWEAVERNTADVLRHAGNRDGHIFNLGHGVLPETPVDTVLRVTEYVQERTRREAS